MNDTHQYVRLKEFSEFVPGHGKVFDGDQRVAEVYRVILIQLQDITSGGDTRVILDCEGVDLITYGLLVAVIMQMEQEGTLQRNFCYHRSFAIMDPNPDTERLLTLLLQEVRCSLFVVYTDTHRHVVREDVLNLSPILRATLDLIKEHGVLSSHQVIGLSRKGVKPTNVRERLRQLFRKGLVKRTARGTVDGDRFFVYEPFSLVNKS